MPEPAASLSDADLMARVARGQSECFAELVYRYQAPLSRVALSRLGRRDWAEDVVQETFLAAFRSSASYDRRYGFRTWLWTILLNQCRTHYHRRRRGLAVASLNDEPPAPSSLADPADSSAPLAVLLAKERAAELEALLAQLPVVQADALRLRFFGGLKFHEIAATVQCSVNTAKNRVRLGLTRMAAQLDDGATGAARRRAHEEPFE